MISIISLVFTSILSHASGLTSGVETYSRHPMTVILCGQQIKQECYGIAGDVTAERDGVCGWSPSEGSCAVVSIGEEPAEEQTCFMHRTIADCINSNRDPAEAMGMPQLVGSGMIDAVERVCAWNPYGATCKDGQLENEPGDFTFGRGTGRGCAWGNPTAATCPVPLCSWNGRSCVSSGLGGLWNFDVMPLQKTHDSESSSKKETTDTWALVGYSCGGFAVGLVLALACVTLRSQKSQMSAPLSFDLIA